MNQERSNDIEFDLREIFSVLIAKAPLILLTGLIFAIVSAAGTKLFITPQYQSVTKMYVLNQQNNDTLTSSDLQTSTLLTKDYAVLIQSRTVTEDVIKKLQLKISHEELLKKLTVATTNDTRVITIKVLDKNPLMARDIANAIRDTSAEHIKKVMNIEAVNVVDEANIPSGKFSPNTTKNAVIAGVLGCFLAIAAVLISYISNDTIKTSEDVERYLNLATLGTIPLNEETKPKKKRKKNHLGYIRR